jgi:Cupin-like domain
MSLFAPEKLTLWLSTRGAHTPLHYDAYGCNLVMQVKGSKKWQLWQPNSFPTITSSFSSSTSPSISSRPPPPSTFSSSSSSLIPIENVPPLDPSRSISATSTVSRNTPTFDRKIIPKLPCLRIPFEESSVYSTYDPRTFTVNDVGHIPPSHSFVLEEGDVLFIPKHYWHFVETVSDLSFSINLWLPFPLPPQPSFFSRKTVHANIDEQECHDDTLYNEIKENNNNNNLISKDDGKMDNRKDRKNRRDRRDRRDSVCTESDAHSYLLEAATRFIFGSLKGSIHTVFDTDDVTAGWVNPSEQAGTLDSAWNLSSSSPSSSSSSSCFEKGDKNERNEVKKDGGEDGDHTDDDGGEKGEGEVEEVEDRSASNESEGTREEAAVHHLAYLHNSIIGYRKTERDKEKDDSMLKENKRSRKEMNYGSRKNGGGGSSSRSSNNGNSDSDSDRSDEEAIGESGDDRYFKTGMKSKKFEEFLKRFVNAVLQPERIEQCLMESLHHKT